MKEKEEQYGKANPTRFELNITSDFFHQTRHHFPSKIE